MRLNPLTQAPHCPMKRPSLFSFLLLGVLVLLLIVGGIGFWLRANRPLPLALGKTAVPEAAMLIPRQAPVMVSLLVQPERLTALTEFIPLGGERQSPQAEVQQLPQKLLANFGLDYPQDLQPWIGSEITFAITTLDLDRQPENGQQPGYLVVLPIRDPERSQEFLDRFWQKQTLAGRQPILEQYQGVKLLATETMPTAAAPSPLATAMVGRRFFLFANHPKVLRTAINTLQVPDLGLSSTGVYQQALAQLQQDRLALAFVNLAALGNQPLDLSMPPPYESLAIALGVNRQGLLAETALIPPLGSKPGSPLPQLTQSPTTLRYVPASSPLVATGVNLGQFWRAFQSSFMGYDLIARLVNGSLDTLKSRWGLDLPEDIFTRIEGEYTLAMLPRFADAAGAKVDWLFVAENQPPANLQQAIARLDAIAADRGLGVSPLILENQKISTWTEVVTRPAPPDLDPAGSALLGARVTGGHAIVDHYRLLATSLDALGRSLKAPEQSLADQTAFQQAIAVFSRPNAGYLYLDWAGSRPILEQQFPFLQTLEAIGYPLFRHLKSLTLTSYGATEGVQRSQLLIKLT